MKQTAEQEKKHDKPAPLWVSTQIKDALKIKAAARGISLSELINEIIAGENRK